MTMGCTGRSDSAQTQSKNTQTEATAAAGSAAVCTGQFKPAAAVAAGGSGPGSAATGRLAACRWPGKFPAACCTASDAVGRLGRRQAPSGGAMQGAAAACSAGAAPWCMRTDAGEQGARQQPPGRLTQQPMVEQRPEM